MRPESDPPYGWSATALDIFQVSGMYIKNTLCFCWAFRENAAYAHNATLIQIQSANVFHRLCEPISLNLRKTCSSMRAAFLLSDLKINLKVTAPTMGVDWKNSIRIIPHELLHFYNIITVLWHWRRVTTKYGIICRLFLFSIINYSHRYLFWKMSIVVQWIPKVKLLSAQNNLNGLPSCRLKNPRK